MVKSKREEMDFNSIINSVERAKIKAASAAKMLSLNEMAKNDEYIHSEGLKISGRPAKSTTRSDNVVEFDIANTSTFSLKERRNDERDSVGNTGTSNRYNNDNRGLSRDNNNMVDSRRNHSNINDDSDNDSVDSFDQDSDPVLRMMKTERVSPPFSDAGLRTPSSTKVSQSENHYSRHNKKDPNRFMSDLDARLATAPASPPMTQSVPYEENEDKQQFSFQSVSKLNWLPSISSSSNIHQSLNNVMKQVSSPFSNSYNQISQDDNNDIEMMRQGNGSSRKVIKTANGDDIHVITSSSLALGDEENAELERLKSQFQSKTDVFAVGLTWIEKNRYYFFIALTFVLTTLGYLYSRKRTDESVT